MSRQDDIDAILEWNHSDPVAMTPLAFSNLIRCLDDVGHSEGTGAFVPLPETAGATPPPQVQSFMNANNSPIGSLSVTSIIPSGVTTVSRCGNEDQFQQNVSTAFFTSNFDTILTESDFLFTPPENSLLRTNVYPD